MSKSKILFFDLETSDLAADIGHILCIGYKFAGQKPVIMSLADYPGDKPNDDSKLIQAFEEIWNQADIAVAHFGDDGLFDLPFLQTRRLVHGLKRLPTVSFVDTWRICKKKLRFGSNRLERVLEVLGCPFSKTPVKLSIWADARAGDRKALKYVIKHCLADIKVLEWVYNKISPLWDPHPMVNKVYKADRTCTLCGKEGLSNGARVTGKNTYLRMSCSACGFCWKGNIIK